MMAGWWLLISHILKTDRGYVIRIMRFGANLARLYRALDARMFQHLQKILKNYLFCNLVVKSDL